MNALRSRDAGRGRGRLRGRERRDRTAGRRFCDERAAEQHDLAGGEEAEGELIDAYLPAELPEPELKAIVERAVQESGATSAKDMGAVMKHAMAAVDGRADGKRVSDLVRTSLQG